MADLTTVTPPAPEACGYQFIDLGLATGTYKHDPTGEYNDPGKLVEGDIVRLDLLVEPGDEGKITPGTYTLSPNRYPAQMRPGVAAATRAAKAISAHAGWASAARSATAIPNTTAIRITSSSTAGSTSPQ